MALLAFSFNANAASEYLENGIKEFKAENFEEALDLFKKAREAEPGSSMAAYYLGLAYKQGGGLKEAADNFRDALRLTPAFLKGSLAGAYYPQFNMFFANGAWNPSVMTAGLNAD